MYAFDFLILLMQVFYTDREMVLYGIVLVATYTIVLDKVLVVGKAQTEVMIVSKEYEQINDMIIHELDRGTTMLKSISGYMKNEYPVIMTVISNRELPKLNHRVLNIDEAAGEENRHPVWSSCGCKRGPGWRHADQKPRRADPDGKRRTLRDRR